MRFVTQPGRPRPKGTLAALSLSLAVVLVPVAAHADAPNVNASNAPTPNADAPNAEAPNANAPNADVAEALFRDGVRLLAEGQTDEACARFFASYQAERANGTLINVAVCHEREGKVATAWAEFRAAADEARRLRRPDRESLAATRVAALEPTVPKLALALPEIQGLVVTLDGKPEEPLVFAAPVPLDPGEHRLEATAPGRLPFATSFTIAAGQASFALAVPHLEAPAAGLHVHSTLDLDATSRTQALADHLSPGLLPHWRRPAAYALGGSGVIALAVAVGLQASALHNDAENRTAAPREPQQALDARQGNAVAQQNWAIASASLGVVAIGAAVYLLVATHGQAAPQRQNLQVQAQARRIGLGLGGTF